MKHNSTRRSDIQLMEPAELAIIDAIRKIEDMIPDTRLTKAQVLLFQAKELVSDVIDEEKENSIESDTPSRLTDEQIKTIEREARGHKY